MGHTAKTMNGATLAMRHRLSFLALMSAHSRRLAVILEGHVVGGIVSLRLFISFFRPTFGFAFCVLSAGLAVAPSALAESAAFDLVGPKLEVRVQRGGATLPIAEVPSLQAGDRLWIHPDLPDSQSVRYLMVVVFLRGATNPPPDPWFTRVETWNRPVHEEGVHVAVPEEAEEALILLAPETGERLARCATLFVASLEHSSVRRRILSKRDWTGPVWKNISMRCVKLRRMIRKT